MDTVFGLMLDFKIRNEEPVNLWIAGYGRKKKTKPLRFFSKVRDD
jgi:hypothetical protein